MDSISAVETACLASLFARSAKMPHFVSRPMLYLELPWLKQAKESTLCQLATPVAKLVRHHILESATLVSMDTT